MNLVRVELKKVTPSGDEYETQHCMRLLVRKCKSLKYLVSVLYWTIDEGYTGGPHEMVTKMYTTVFLQTTQDVSKIEMVPKQEFEMGITGPTQEITGKLYLGECQRQALTLITRALLIDADLCSTLLENRDLVAYVWLYLVRQPIGV